MEYKDGLPVLDYEELVSYIMEESQYPKTDIERILDLETEYMEKLEFYKGIKIYKLVDRKGDILKMTKSELIKTIAEKVDGVTQEKAKEVVGVVLDEITDALVSGDRVQFVGFGTFEVKERAAREGRNPQTGETMQIASSKNVKFKAGKELKDKVNA